MLKKGGEETILCRDE